MPDLDEAVRSLVERPFAPPTPVEVIERRARSLTRRRQIARGGAVAVIAAALFAVVLPDRGDEGTHVTSVDGWRTYQNHGLVVRYPPGWVVLGEPSMVEDSVDTEGRETETAIPGVVLASRRLGAHETAALARSEGEMFPSDLITFEVSDGGFNEIDELGPPDGGLGRPRVEPNGWRRRVGQASSMFDMVARSGPDAPEGQWSLVDRVAASVRVPTIDLEDGGPSMSESDKAAVNATRVAASARYRNLELHRTETQGIGYSLLVGDRCLKLRLDPPASPDPIDGMMHGRCSKGWRRPGARSVKVLEVLSYDASVQVIARAGSDITRIAARRADGTVVDGAMSDDGWALLLSEGGLIARDRVIVGAVEAEIIELLAYDAKGRLLWSGPARPAPWR